MECNSVLFCNLTFVVWFTIMYITVNHFIMDVATIYLLIRNITELNFILNANRIANSTVTVFGWDSKHIYMMTYAESIWIKWIGYQSLLKAACSNVDSETWLLRKKSKVTRCTNVISINRPFENHAARKSLVI